MRNIQKAIEDYKNLETEIEKLVGQMAKDLPTGDFHPSEVVFREKTYHVYIWLIGEGVDRFGRPVDFVPNGLEVRTPIDSNRHWKFSFMWERSRPDRPKLSELHELIEWLSLRRIEL